MTSGDDRSQQRANGRGQPGGEQPKGPRRTLGWLAQGWIWLLVGLLVRPTIRTWGGARP